MAVRPFIIAVSDAAPHPVAKRVAGSRIVFTTLDPAWIRSGARLQILGRILHDNPVGFTRGPLETIGRCAERMRSTFSRSKHD